MFCTNKSSPIHKNRLVETHQTNSYDLYLHTYTSTYLYIQICIFIHLFFYTYINTHSNIYTLVTCVK